MSETTMPLSKFAQQLADIPRRQDELRRTLESLQTHLLKYPGIGKVVPALTTVRQQLSAMQKQENALQTHLESLQFLLASPDGTHVNRMLLSKDYYHLLYNLMHGTKADVLQTMKSMGLRFTHYVRHTPKDPGWCIRDIVITHGSEGAGQALEQERLDFEVQKKAQEQERLRWKQQHANETQVAKSVVKLYGEATAFLAQAPRLVCKPKRMKKNNETWEQLEFSQFQTMTSNSEQRLSHAVRKDKCAAYVQCLVQAYVLAAKGLAQAPYFHDFETIQQNAWSTLLDFISGLLNALDYFSAKFVADIVYDAISNIGLRDPAYEKLLTEGTKVVARCYSERSRRRYSEQYYLAFITRVNANGTYDLTFENSPSGFNDKDWKVERVFIVPIEHQPGKHVLTKRTNVLVKSVERGRTVYHPASIKCMNSDGTYDVTYDRGDKVPRSSIRERGPPMLNELRDRAHVGLASVVMDTRKPFIARATNALEEREWTVASAAASNGLNCIPDHWEDSKPVELLDLKKRAEDTLKAAQEAYDRQRAEALYAEEQARLEREQARRAEAHARAEAEAREAQARATAQALFNSRMLQLAEHLPIETRVQAYADRSKRLYDANVVEHVEPGVVKIKFVKFKLWKKISTNKLYIDGAPFVMPELTPDIVPVASPAIARAVSFVPFATLPGAQTPQTAQVTASASVLAAPTAVASAVPTAMVVTGPASAAAESAVPTAVVIP